MHGSLKKEQAHTEGSLVLCQYRSLEIRGHPRFVASSMPCKMCETNKSHQSNPRHFALCWGVEAGWTGDTKIGTTKRCELRARGPAQSFTPTGELHRPQSLVGGEEPLTASDRPTADPARSSIWSLTASETETSSASKRSAYQSRVIETEESPSIFYITFRLAPLDTALLSAAW